MIRARGTGIDVPVWVQREVPYSVFISFLLVSRLKLFDMFSTRAKLDTFAFHNTLTVPVIRAFQLRLGFVASYFRHEDIFCAIYAGSSRLI